KQTTRSLLIFGRQFVESSIRSLADGSSHAAGLIVGIAVDGAALAQMPTFLEGVLQERQHPFVLARLVKNALNQVRRLERQADDSRGFNNGALQLSARHRSEHHLLPRQEFSDMLMSNQGIIEVGAHRPDDGYWRSLRGIQQQCDEAIDVLLVLCIA